MAKATDLDKFRGHADRKATETRRRRRSVADDQAILRARFDELEKNLFAGPARGWPDAVEKARYLLALFAGDTADPRFQKMITSVLADFERLLSFPPEK
jgi:hypothetical protein